MKTPDQVKALVRAEFEKYDANGNGFLEKQEVKDLLDDTCAKMNEPPISEGQLEKIFGSLDTNKDGKLSFDELYRLVGPLLAH